MSIKKLIRVSTRRCNVCGSQYKVYTYQISYRKKDNKSEHHDKSDPNNLPFQETDGCSYCFEESDN